MRKKDNDIFKDLPVMAVDYIKLVIKRMGYRKKVRADVQAELITHFQDGLKDCKSDEEKQAAVKNLIEEFGDPKVLGKLMKRAKKRCRSLWRKAIANTFKTVGVLLIVLVLYVGWFLSGKPIITTNYVEQLNRIVKPMPSVDPNLNANRYYSRAAEILEQKKEQDKHYSDVLGMSARDANSEDRAKIHQWLEDNNDLLEMVEDGSKLPYCWPQYYTVEGHAADEAIAILMSHMGSYKNFAQALGWRARLAAETGDFEAAFDDVMVCCRFGKHLKQGDKTLVEQLVGIYVELSVFEITFELLDKYDIDATVLSQFQRRINKEIADDDFVISFVIEKLWMRDEIQRSFTNDSIGKGHLYLNKISEVRPYLWKRSKLKTAKIIIRLLFINPNKKETLVSIDRLYSAADKFAKMSPVKIHEKNINIQQKIENLTETNLFFELFTTPLNGLIEIGYRLRAHASAAQAIIAAVRYKAENGVYPDSLDELLEKGYLKSLPIDPFSDKPFAYRKTNDSFLVYSYGTNCEDDGGEVYRYPDGMRKGQIRKFAEQGDWVFWPMAE